MPFIGCGNILKISDPSVEKYLIHHFYPDEPESEIELSEDDQKCLNDFANKFHITPISQLKKDTSKTKLLKKLLHIGMTKIQNHIQPVDIKELKNKPGNDVHGFKTGFEHKVVLKAHLEPVNISTTKDYKSFQTGISLSDSDEPTVEEVLLNPWIYIEWQISKGRLNKGGSTRRKKSRGRKTRKYL
jgi:hypothetical protein